MNILYLTNHLNIGGITSYVLSLASGLKKKDHNVYVASSDGQLVSRFIREGITYIPIPIKTKKDLSPKILVSMFKLSRLIKQRNIDIAHSNSRTTQILGCLLSRFNHIPHISTCHGFFKRRFTRRAFPCWGKRVIAISESVREHLIKDFGVKEKDIRLIHNGVDIEKFNPALSQKGGTKLKIEIKKEFGLGEGPVIGIIARLSEEKGHSYLIRAMQEVILEVPDTQLIIVGEGRLKNELMNLSKILGLEKSVFFIPQVLKTQEVLSIMDIFVLPSLKEGLGLSMIEAMASAVCVIGTDVGGIRSLIKDGVNGLLIKPADSKQLSNAIIELLKDAVKREFLGNNARISIMQNFSQEKMVLETERVYVECLDESR